jgi:hypothetical protein
MELTPGSETSTHLIQTPGLYPKKILYNCFIVVRFNKSGVNFLIMAIAPKHVAAN